MKIYTKKGDTGETSLFGGRRVKKNSPRIEAYGTVDELNSILGVALSQSPSRQVEQILHDLQHQLFVLGADLATPLSAKTRIDRIGPAGTDMLESTIDELEEGLPDLNNFILPGGSSCGSTLHLARTVCRRAERAAVACSGSDQDSDRISDESIVYLNRLSDLLFVLARFENLQANQNETPWKAR
ncbi:MAG: cob(I)yrinic acid a,c-diamide adenosyltransferase [Balneolaceae bacterium]